MNFAERVANWADTERSVRALVLIGSRVRSESDTLSRADAASDWDFHIITSNPSLFANAKWTNGLGVPLRIYAPRVANIGRVLKAAALFVGAEADFVVLPSRSLKLAKMAVALGLHRKSPAIRRRLQDLAVIVRPGWRFLKGAERWESFYRRVVSEIADQRLNDPEVRGLASGFVCDASWVLRKIERGEFLAAQRMIHCSLAEINFRLLHELKLRRGERTFPEGRRTELTSTTEELLAVSINATPEGLSLRESLTAASATCRKLTRLIVGDTWSWPEL